MSTMRIEDLATLRDTSEENLTLYHFGLGMYIRKWVRPLEGEQRPVVVLLQ